MMGCLEMSWGVEYEKYVEIEEKRWLRIDVNCVCELRVWSCACEIPGPC